MDMQLITTNLFRTLTLRLRPLVCDHIIRKLDIVYGDIDLINKIQRRSVARHVCYHIFFNVKSKHCLCLRFRSEIKSVNIIKVTDIFVLHLYVCNETRLYLSNIIFKYTHPLVGVCIFENYVINICPERNWPRDLQCRKSLSHCANHDFKISNMVLDIRR